MFGRISLVAGLSLLLLVAAGCDDGGYQKANQNQGSSGPVTGLLIVAQTMEGDTVDIAHESVITWNVVDAAGAKIFGKDEIDAKFMQKGVKYERNRQRALAGSSMWLGKNHREIHIQEVKLEGEEKAQTAVLVVGPAEADELRSIPNLADLVRKSMLVFLVGKIGQ